MTEASVSVESRAAGGGDLCSSSFGVRMGCMMDELSSSRQIGKRVECPADGPTAKALSIR